MTFTLSDDDIRRCREISIGKRELIMDIVRAVSEATGVPIDAIKGPRNFAEIVEARRIICYIAHVERGHTTTAIGRVISKDHSTVSHAARAEKKRREGMTKAPE